MSKALSLLALCLALWRTDAQDIALFNIVACPINLPSGGFVLANVDERCCAEISARTGELDAIFDPGALAAFLSSSPRSCFSQRFTQCLQFVVDLVNANPTGYTTFLEEAATLCPLTELTCCSYGTKHVDGSVCCPPGCVECGGLNCAAGGDQCCKTFLFNEAPPCNAITDTACTCPVISRTAPSSSPTDVLLPARRTEERSTRRDEMCANGLIHDVVPVCDSCEKQTNPAAKIQVCCDASCGSCGGEFCGLMSTPDMSCCVDDIVSDNVFCTEQDQVGCILKASTPWAETQ